MAVKKDLKRIIRARMAETDESYTTARAQVLRDQQDIAATGLSMSTPLFALPRPSAARGSSDCQSPGDEGALDAAILKLNYQSARVRLLGTDEQITFRSSDFLMHVPGQIVTLLPRKRWTHRGYAYATGEVVDARIDIPALGLPPLGLEEHGLMNCREVYEPEHSPGPLRALWHKTSTKPRPYFEMEQVLRGIDKDAFLDVDVDDPIIMSSELNGAGASRDAEEILMGLLLQDLRCLDAHAHLGNFAFERCPSEALLHYEVGVRIGEQALGSGFTGMLPWSCVDNRPFLRCIHGYGLALWRLGKMKEAEQVFERMVWLNPNDNQGARFCWLDVKAGRLWNEACG